MAFDALPPAAMKSAQVKRVPLGKSRRRLSFEKRLQMWLYLMSLPLLATAFLLLYGRNATWGSIAICEIGVVLCWALAVSILTEQIVRPLQTLANVVAALREDDYSFRARGARRNDAMGDLALEVNALAGMLQSQRTGALEAMALLERVMASMESPVLAFDGNERLLMLNAAGERAFGVSCAKAFGQSAKALHFTHLLEARDGELVLLRQHLQQTDRWVIKRSHFRLRGVQNTLLMLSNVSKALRVEERIAWERLIRVLGHEINNSLTPIKSIAGSLRGRIEINGASADFERGLAVIENRAESLNRFLQAYRQLMRLPTPRREQVSLAALVDRVVQMEARLPVSVAVSEDVVIHVDPAQIEQALINLVRNAVEAALSPDATKTTSPGVQLRWTVEGNELVIYLVDSGLGLTNETNLFVPFYTTKPEGTGIGLVLAQQIAEAHSGSVRLSNRPDGQGCVAELRLPRKDTPDTK
jgi:two-component system, NtrC family, nitrogen regulation sensor histidine kinase NtrY